MSWELDLNDVCVIGEYTTDHGPFVDDYFFCFATAGEVWYEASYYALGVEQAFDELHRRLGGRSLLCRLTGSTGFASNIMWPGRIEGEPMFEFVPCRTAGWFSSLLGIPSNKQSLSHAALRACRGAAAASR